MFGGDTLIKRLGNVFRLKSLILNLTTANSLGQSGCHFSSSPESIIAPFLEDFKISVMCL